MQQRVTDHPPVSAKMGKSLPLLMLRLEGAFVLLSSIALYGWLGGSVWAFIALLFTPDLVFLLYPINQRLGFIAYDLLHSYSMPILCGVIALSSASSWGVLGALIWFAHIGLDRMIGYGLRYPTVGDTHLDRV